MKYFPQDSPVRCFNQGKQWQLNKSIAKGIAGLTILLAIVGCNEVSSEIQKRQFMGTNLGLDRCIEVNKSASLSEGIVRSLCLEQNERNISPRYEARAGYESSSNYTFFSGSITNLSKDQIITSFIFHIKHNDNVDNSGNQIFEVAEVKDRWVEPGTTQWFSINELKFTPAANRLREGEKFLYSWQVQKIKGITAKLR